MFHQLSNQPPAAKSASLWKPQPQHTLASSSSNPNWKATNSGPPKPIRSSQPPKAEQTVSSKGPKLSIIHVASRTRVTSSKGSATAVAATPKCPLSPCSASKLCGPAAICSRGFCACPPGRMGFGAVVRGEQGPKVCVSMYSQVWPAHSRARIRTATRSEVREGVQAWRTRNLERGSMCRPA